MREQRTCQIITRQQSQPVFKERSGLFICCQECGLRQAVHAGNKGPHLAHPQQHDLLAVRQRESHVALHDGRDAEGAAARGQPDVLGPVCAAPRLARLLSLCVPGARGAWQTRGGGAGQWWGAKEAMRAGKQMPMCECGHDARLHSSGGNADASCNPFARLPCMVMAAGRSAGSTVRCLVGVRLLQLRVVDVTVVSCGIHRAGHSHVSSRGSRLGGWAGEEGGSEAKKEYPQARAPHVLLEPRFHRRLAHGTLVVRRGHPLPFLLLSLLLYCLLRCSSGVERAQGPCLLPTKGCTHVIIPCLRGQAELEEEGGRAQCCTGGHYRV